MRRPGAITGVIAGIVGLLGWLYALFGPTGQYESTTVSTGGGPAMTESGWTSMWGNEDLEAITIVFLAWMLLSVIGVLAGAILHGHYQLKAGRTILWASAVILMLGSVLSMFSIGLLLVPGAVLAIIAAILVSSGREADRHAVQR